MRTKLPHLLLLVASLVATGHCTLFAQQQGSISYPPTSLSVFRVIASDAPAWMRIRGPGLYLCNGDADDLEIQAAIDAAEATGLKCTVDLSPGTYDMDSPIYIGYSAGQPNQTVGCNLITSGYVILDSDINDLQKFQIYFSPLPTGNQPRIEGPLLIQGGIRAGGIYSTSLTTGSIRNVRVFAGRVAGIWCDNSWTLELKGLLIDGQGGIAFGMTEFNAGSASDIVLIGNTGRRLGESGYYGVNRYGFDAGTNTFWPGEEVKITNDAGATKGVLLAVYVTGSSPTQIGTIWVGHANVGVYVNNDVVYGDDSGATCVVDGSETDIGSCLYVEGGHGYIQNVSIENVNYADEANNDYEFPLVYVDSRVDNNSRQMVLENFRFEGGTTDTDLRRMAQTWFRIDHADGTVIRNVQAQHKGGDDTISVRDNSVSVSGDGDSTSTITADAAFVLALATGDKVYLWDGAGGGTDGEYTVEAGASGDTFGISDGDFTDGDMFAWAKTASNDRMTPSVLIDIIDCEHVLVENVRAYTFQTALVQIDSDCTNTEIRNILPYQLAMNGATEGNNLYKGKHGVIVSDAGTGTKLINPFIQNYTGLIYVGKTGIEVIDETDGITHKTTLLLKDQTVTLADEAGVVAYGGQKVFDFPEGAILIEGVTTDLAITKSSAGVNADWDGDYSVGSVTASNNATLTATEDDMLPSTATPQASSSATTADGQSTAAENVVIDGTSTPVDALLNFLVDDADHNVAGTPCNLIVNGPIVIHWRNLGDY